MYQNCKKDQTHKQKHIPRVTYSRVALFYSTMDDTHILLSKIIIYLFTSKSHNTVSIVGLKTNM